MPEQLVDAWDWIVPHLWGVGYVFSFAFVGEVMKRKVWTEKNVRAMARERDKLWNAGGWRRFFGWLLLVAIAIPLPFHPIFASALLGCFPVPISEGVEPTFWNRLAYVVILGGVVSQGLYSTIHSLARKKGLDFQLPGESRPPPPIREDELEDDEA